MSKQNSSPVYLVYLIPALVVCLIGAVASYGQNKAVKSVPARPTASVSGKDLFTQYCAVCHGNDGKGNGPAASALKTAPGDLTLITLSHKGTFPEARVLGIIKGEISVPSHGTQDMPMWGPIFKNMGGSLNTAQLRIHGLLDYIEQIQMK